MAAAAATHVQAAAQELDNVLSELAALLTDMLGDQEDPDSPVLRGSGRFWGQLHQLKARHNESLSLALLALAKSGAF